MFKTCSQVGADVHHCFQPSAAQSIEPDLRGTHGSMHHEAPTDIVLLYSFLRHFLYVCHSCILLPTLWLARCRSLRSYSRPARPADRTWMADTFYHLGTHRRASSTQC